MKKLLYLTSNQFKYREAAEVLIDQYGFDLEIMDPDFELYEIQAKTCAEVVAFTAKYGANKLGKPCLKSDTGLYLEALGGLPGPYNAYFDKQIGVEKFLSLIKNEKNRKAYIEHCFAYCEPGKEPVVFKYYKLVIIVTVVGDENFVTSFKSSLNPAHNSNVGGGVFKFELVENSINKFVFVSGFAHYYLCLFLFIF